MKAFVVDTVATVIFFTLVAAFSELVIVGMTPQQVLVARALMIPVMVLTARPYGVWRDWIMQAARNAGPIGRAIVDTAAFLTFQIPIYAGTLVIAGATASEIAIASTSATTFMLVIGRPFGLFLEVVRRKAGVAVLS
ncbi:MAG: L-alanine exporter AlaE [Rhizobiaceae bacterium]